MQSLGWTLQEWQDAYSAGQQPEQLLGELLRAQSLDDVAWISLIEPVTLAAECARLQARLAEAGSLAALPLYGVPFAVKDNIDVAGLPTTAACPAFRYLPEQDAGVVARLRAAGAVVLGKSNLDQFATGLVGTRSPYGAVPNSVNADYVCGGSSAGSASLVARGLVPFALGTDTAGSGRVPAGFNNLVGWKPTRGAISCRGVVPACKSLDCVSLFTLTVADAEQLALIAYGEDASDPFSRASQGAVVPRRGSIPTLGVPRQLAWFGDEAQRLGFEAACATLAAQGVQLVEVDYQPFAELAHLLYEGPWLAERRVALAEFLAGHRDEMDPVVAGIIAQADGLRATEAFAAEYRRQALKARIQQQLGQLDALLLPTAPRLPTLAQVRADPVVVNSQLGHYCNWVNLADCCALSLPAGFRPDGLPLGVTLVAPAWQEWALARLAKPLAAGLNLPLGATGRPAPSAPSGTVLAPDHQVLAVVGAHLSGQPLNHQLTDLGGYLLETSRSAPHYRLFALADGRRPALVAGRTPGAAIELELWALPKAAWADLLARVPSPLGLGSVQLADGRRVAGFICEPLALEGARDITAHGSWRAYLAAQAQPARQPGRVAC
ncbi:allophanate hydrolase [Pseudaeromonas sp. ZJS20]|uniref:allophanate hydrolase n=1 Tax=Pseudaeromonas aegiceratis TaxID=3153928 RepID=UPI00390CD178